MGRPGGLSYCTAMVTPFCDGTPPTDTLMGTDPPGDTDDGTTAFTWNSPATEAPAEPAYCTTASCPPMVTFTARTGVFRSVPITLPVTPCGDVSPSPVATLEMGPKTAGSAPSHRGEQFR